ncbi:MAG: reductive dehalogenase domain-containing protein [candidate division WOR-3 bacterium]
MSLIQLRSDLETFCRSRGVVAFGVAELKSIKIEDFLLPKETLNRMPFAISLVMRLSYEVLITITDHPNQLYEHHYRQVNFALDRVALEVANRLQQSGYRALPVPASQIVDWQNQRGHLSHKRIAIASGLGWLGRNNLLVTPEFGAQVRLVTVLTDFPLEPGAPLSGNCGTCRGCIPACPAKAIKESAKDFDFRACFEKLKEFQRLRYVNQFICGICVRVCRGKGVT